jgi:hypothetical protein
MPFDGRQIFLLLLHSDIAMRVKQIPHTTICSIHTAPDSLDHDMHSARIVSEVSVHGKAACPTVGFSRIP